MLRVLALLSAVVSAFLGSRSALRAAGMFRAGADEQAVLVARGPVDFLSADRGRVALGVEYGSSPTIAVWYPAKRTVVRFHTALGGMRVSPEGVALGGGTVAWLGSVETGAHERPMVLMRAQLGHPSSPAVAAFSWSPDGSTGTLLGDLHGGGSHIAFDTYYVCDSNARLDPRCQPGFNPNDVAEEQVYALNTGDSGVCAAIPSGADPGGGDITFPPDPAIRCRQLLQTTGAATVLAVGGGRIAIGRPDGSVALVDRAGTSLATFTSAEGIVRAVAVDAEEAVLLVRTDPWRAVIEIRDPSSGALERSLTLVRIYATMGPDDCTTSSCPSLRLESTARGLVVYTLRRTLHVLRIADTRDVTLARSLHASALHGQLDQTGLFYSYDVRDDRHPGRVVHLAWSALAQVLDQHH